MVCSIVLGCLILLPGIAKASDDVVETVTVSIAANQAPTTRIAKRMSASVRVVGEQMLVGRNISDVANAKAGYENLITEVFDRVLVGYSVQSVNLTPATNTILQVKVVPWGDIVHETALEVDYGTISPELQDLMQQDMGNIEENINDVLIGLPIDSLEWAGGVSKLVIRELLAEKLPEFRADFDIIPGARTVVKLSLIPMGAIVQDVNVSLRSHTLPNVLLALARPKVDSAGKSLVGLPVAFIERHRVYFTDKITVTVAENSIAKRYGLTLTPVIRPGVATEIALDAETDKYKVTLEGYMDMGRSEDNTSFRLHAGKMMSKQDEAFTEVNFVPSSVAWNVVPGWAHRMSAITTAGIKYDLSDKRGLVWLHQEISPNISLRLERTPAINKNEFAIRYKMQDFLSAEYIMNQDKSWLRLVGNL